MYCINDVVRIRFCDEPPEIVTIVGTVPMIQDDSDSEVWLYRVHSPSSILSGAPLPLLVYPREILGLATDMEKALFEK